MFDFWSMYKSKIHERFEMEKSLANSESHGELINFEILVGMCLLRPETTISEKTSDFLANEFSGIKVEEIGDISDTKKHEQDSNNFPHKCKTCEKTFRYISKLLEHEVTHNTEEIFPCNMCTQRFRHKLALRVHLKRIHEPKIPKELRPEKLVCKICEKKFRYISQLREHEVTHNTEQPFSCNMCSKRFKYQRTLSKHLQRPHEPKTQEISTCKICEKTFRYISQLRAHEYSHNNEKLFSCKMCTESFKYPSALAKHLKERHESTRYACKFCDYQTTKLCHLRRHDRDNHPDATIEEVP